MSAEPTRERDRRATGPRTSEGRKRAAQNARRHGLTASRSNEAAITAQVAHWITGTLLATAPYTALMRLAEARYQVAQVRDYQVFLLEQLSNFVSAEAQQLSATDQPTQTDRTTLVQHYQLSLRYRAEAEARVRKALRDITAHMTARNATGNT
ncbi:hypothetical protein AN191_13180 [Loktanella sp. 5RATIMAR09]|nr:hypothetical protein AN191_13180 [Loktanella sp. 5RATIMAR09]